MKPTKKIAKLHFLLSFQVKTNLWIISFFLNSISGKKHMKPNRGVIWDTFWTAILSQHCGTTFLPNYIKNSFFLVSSDSHQTINQLPNTNTTSRIGDQRCAPRKSNPLAANVFKSIFFGYTTRRQQPDWANKSISVSTRRKKKPERCCDLLQSKWILKVIVRKWWYKQIRKSLLNHLSLLAVFGKKGEREREKKRF